MELKRLTLYVRTLKWASNVNAVSKEKCRKSRQKSLRAEKGRRNRKGIVKNKIIWENENY